METFLYYLARTIVASARCLPLRALAWVGRRLGGLAWILDKRHRTVARKTSPPRFLKNRNTMSPSWLVTIFNASAKPTPAY